MKRFAGLLRKGSLLIIAILLLTASSVVANPGKILWKYEFTRLPEAYMSKPTVAGNRVYISTAMGDLIALNVNNGSELWKNLTANPNRNIQGPAVALHGNRIYLQNLDDYTKGVMNCYDAAAGRVIWTFYTTKGTNPNVRYGRRQIKSVPVYYNGRLYFHDYQGIVYCLNALTGALIWKSDINVILKIQASRSWSNALNRVFESKPEAIEYRTPIIIEGERLFTATHSGLMVCLNLADGSKRWIRDFQSNLNLRGVFNGRVYAVYAPWIGGPAKKEHTMICFDASSGQQLWKSARLPGTETHSLFLINGQLDMTCINALFGSPAHLSYRVRINPSTGRIIYRQNLPFDTRSKVLIENNKRYYLRWDFKGYGDQRSFDYVLYCEDASSGRFLWKTPVIVNSRNWYFSGHVPKSKLNGLAAANGRAFVTVNKTIWCIQTGTELPAANTDSGRSSGADPGSTGGGQDPYEGE